VSVTFEIEGLEELRMALRHLPTDLAGEATHLVQAATNGAEATIKAGYAAHVVSGELLKKFTATLTVTGIAALGTLRNRSPLAFIFENGTEARHYVSKHGVTHLTGRMRGLHVFVPTMIRKRRQLDDGLRDLLERHGLIVSETAEALF
jgi:hypothetical protein